MNFDWEKFGLVSNYFTFEEQDFVSLHDEEDGSQVEEDPSQLVQVKMNDLMKLK